ncbi:golgin subfamily A member 4-like [Ranitomeya imitator]|uniref:golgin subfamily A member 4-like n=1 Tax=Ranitomeya imitator TaxID=111125 RepID=UPI0037E746B1
MSASKIPADKSSDLSLPVELIEVNADTSVESQESFDLCNNIHSPKCKETMSPTNAHAKDLQNNQYDETNTHKTSFDDVDMITDSTVSEIGKALKNHSLDFPAKNTMVGFSRTESTRNGKRKPMPQIPKCRKLGTHYDTEIVSHKLEFVEEENLSEQEESSEDDNLDYSLPYSRDRLDHRKERHQYVSDQLDPDVLHLLEMHLRKQQLVDIKEEREEELLDVHINKEKSRSESFKLLRNISPVLDMVLEEPELEHSGDTLEEDSKTPSYIDSDDDSNSYAVELGLMESLENDLMSKSNKIENDEIATILQTVNDDISTREINGKQKPTVCNSDDGKIKCEAIKNTEPKARRGGTEGSSKLLAEKQISVDGSFTSGFNSESIAGFENGHDLEVQSESDIYDSRKELTDKSKPQDEVETEKDSIEKPDNSFQCLSIKSGKKDLNLDINCETVSDTKADVLYKESPLSESKEEAITESKSESVRNEDISIEQCSAIDGHVKHDIDVPCLDGYMSLPKASKSTDTYSTTQTDQFRSLAVSTEQHDAEKLLGVDDVGHTDLKEELKPVNKEHLSEPSPGLSAEMSTLRSDLEEKILSIMEKAHAADCRSSHLQAGAELLWKESMELRNECKSLSKEAAELLSIFNQQRAVHRQPRRQSSQRTKAVGSLLSTTDTKLSDTETLSLSRKNDSRDLNKGEDRLQLLSKNYNFLREEAPELMKELHVLQQDLKSLPSHHSKPMNILYSLLWGGLMTGGAMLLVWWSTKQLG